MSSNRSPEQNSLGIVLAIGAYLSWVLFPIYFKQLQAVPPLEIMAHRSVWSLLVVVVILTMRQRWAWLTGALHKRFVLASYTATAILLGLNWYVYIWAVNHGHIVDASLGYFINPLASVLLAVIFLHERLRPGQWLAIALAALGVGYMAVVFGHVPWIALALTLTWGAYGLLKKVAPLPAAEGLALETATLTPLAVAFLLYLNLSGEGHFGHVSPWMNVLLASSGVITAVPLIMFAAAAQRIPLSLLGIMQYIAPTGQFLVGVLIYGEAFPLYKVIGFATIWIALILFTLEGILVRRRNLRLAARPI